MGEKMRGMAQGSPQLQSWNYNACEEIGQVTSAEMRHVFWPPMLAWETLIFEKSEYLS